MRIPTLPRLRSVPAGHVFPLLVASAVAARVLPVPLGAVVGIPVERTMSDGVALAASVAVLAVTLLPFLAAAAAWRILPRGMRMGVLGVLAALAAPTAYRAAAHVEWMAAYAADVRAVSAELAPQRAAMRVPPEVAARRAIAAGNRAFLGVHHHELTVPGVRNECVLRTQGWMVVRGTGHSFRTLGEMRFQQEAVGYAVRYNAEVIRRLGLDPAEAARTVDECLLAPMRLPGDTPLWPDGVTAGVRQTDESE